MKNDKKVLILEPERIAGLELQQQLEKKGFSVKRPISLVDAEVVVAKDKPDLVIADTDIKQQSIFERMKKHLKKFKLPFIWIGSFTKKEAKEEGKKTNIIGVFAKPFDSKKIVALIISYFNKAITILFHRDKKTLDTKELKKA
jgi:DNA-binding NtrC family response regulator